MKVKAKHGTATTHHTNLGAIQTDDHGFVVSVNGQPITDEIAEKIGTLFGKTFDVVHGLKMKSEDAENESDEDSKPVKPKRKLFKAKSKKSHK